MEEGEQRGGGVRSEGGGEAKRLRKCGEFREEINPEEKAGKEENIICRREGTKY